MTPLSQATVLGDVLRGHSQLHPAKVAVETLDGRSVTFAHLNSRVNSLVASVSTVGISKGARVAILARNMPEYLEVFGLAKAGIVVVPLNWRLTSAEIAKLLTHCEAELVFVDDAHLELASGLRAGAPSVRHWVSIGAAAGDGWIPCESLIASGSDEEPSADVGPADVCCLIYTSGTTGAPKGVAVTHAGVLGNARTSAGEVLGLSPNDRTLSVMPLFHAGGMWYHFFPSIAAGCTTLLLPGFEAATVLRALDSHRITNVHLVPTMISALLALPEVQAADLSALRLLFYAASSMPAELLRRALQALPRCEFVQSYGSTEGGMVSVLDMQAHRQAREPASEHLLLSCGKPCAQREVRIVGAAGAVLASREIGELEVRSPDMMLGYWHNPDATAVVLQSGWLKTGDLGYADEEGYLYIVDRKNDMIITGGENVYPTEVEGVLYRDPAVQDAAVFGIPDSVWVEKVVAAVVLKPGTPATEQEIIDRTRARLAGYKCPKAVYFVSSLPKNGAGKVLRAELRRQFAAR